MINPISKMETAYWIQILAILINLLHIIGSTPTITHEEFYIFPHTYLKFSMALGSDEPKYLEIIEGYKSTTQSPLSVDPDIYNHIKKYEYQVTAPFSKTSEEQRVQEMKKIHELCHVAADTHNSATILFSCPDEEMIYPCTCTEADQTLNCSNVNSFTDLKTILNNAVFPSTKFDKFSYFPGSPSIEQRVLLDNTFGSLTFVRMMIEDTGLVKVESNALSGSEDTLQVLHFINNKNLKEIPFQDILNNFPKLNTLLAISGSITEIPKLESTSLTLLDLNTNLISVLEYDTFKNLPLLESLDLSYNQIETVGPNGWFFSTSSLIYISNNKLASVSPFASYQPTIFDASENELTSFSQDVFEPILKQGYFVSVESNDIPCTDLEWATNNKDYCKNVLSDCKKICLFL